METVHEVKSWVCKNRPINNKVGKKSSNKIKTIFQQQKKKQKTFSSDILQAKVTDNSQGENGNLDYNQIHYRDRNTIT